MKPYGTESRNGGLLKCLTSLLVICLNTEGFNLSNTIITNVIWYPYPAVLPKEYESNLIVWTKDDDLEWNIFYTNEDSSHDHSPWQRTKYWTRTKDLNKKVNGEKLTNRNLKGKYKGKWIVVDKLPPDAKCDQWQMDLTKDDVEKLSHEPIVKKIELYQEKIHQ
jgi:hypothetical protein